MTEAMKAVLIHGFEQMKLNRVEAFASPLNTPSIRLIERYGFTKEGLLRQHYGHNGVAEDSAVYGLLASEYEVVKHKW
jgi:[ribosomal protein S5]-alanine N-acetyltransferase